MAVPTPNHCPTRASHSSPRPGTSRRSSSSSACSTAGRRIVRKTLTLFPCDEQAGKEKENRYGNADYYTYCTLERAHRLRRAPGVDRSLVFGEIWLLSRRTVWYYFAESALTRWGRRQSRALRPLRYASLSGLP